MKSQAHRAEPPGESLATLFLGAAALLAIFLLLFVLVPVAAAPAPETSTGGTIHESVTVVEP